MRTALVDKGRPHRPHKRLSVKCRSAKKGDLFHEGVEEFAVELLRGKVRQFLGSDVWLEYSRWKGGHASALFPVCQLRIIYSWTHHRLSYVSSTSNCGHPLAAGNMLTAEGVVGGGCCIL